MRHKNTGAALEILCAILTSLDYIYAVELSTGLVQSDEEIRLLSA
jgi:hypothetical protein